MRKDWIEEEELNTNMGGKDWDLNWKWKAQRVVLFQDRTRFKGENEKDGPINLFIRPSME